MNPLTPQIDRSYYFRMGCLALICFGIGSVLVGQGLKYGNGLMVIVGLTPALVCALFMGWEYIRGPKVLDQTGVTRCDGKRFLWTELKQIKYINTKATSQQLNHVELHFPTGQVRVFPLTLSNAGEVLRFIENLKSPPSKVPPPAPLAPPSPSVPSHQNCSICSQLSNYHYGLQKGGHEAEDTYLPEIASRLKKVKEITPGKNRTPELWQCPVCRTYYLFEVGYEYLATGSEDEQKLSRLSAAEAAQYL